MKFGVREICDVVLKAKAAQKIGNKIFYAGEPVCYFDTLKTSSMEGAATTVYAQGGRGNARLMAWEGERTVTFTMEDALISPEGFMILSGAGLIDAEQETIYQHVTETVDKRKIKAVSDEGKVTGLEIIVYEEPYLPTDENENFAYVMLVKDSEIQSEPYIPVHATIDAEGNETWENVDAEKYPLTVTDEYGKVYHRVLVQDHKMYVAASDYEEDPDYIGDKVTHKYEDGAEGQTAYDVKDIPAQLLFNAVLVDYCTARKAGAKQMDITADKFGGNYYLEASTLFRDTNGVDMPAEFIIPNCKIQSNFTFTMASSGDPSSFTFTMDAFPDYTRFDRSKKVLAAIQVIEYLEDQDLHRHSTKHENAHNSLNW